MSDCEMMDREIAGERKVPLKKYLIIYGSSDDYYTCRSASLCEAIWSLAEYTGCSNEILRHALHGFYENDKRLIELFNLLCNWNDDISKVFVIDSEIYDEKKEEQKNDKDK